MTKKPTDERRDKIVTICLDDERGYLSALYREMDFGFYYPNELKDFYLAAEKETGVRLKKGGNFAQYLKLYFESQEAFLKVHGMEVPCFDCYFNVPKMQELIYALQEEGHVFDFSAILIKRNSWEPGLFEEIGIDEESLRETREADEEKPEQQGEVSFSAGYRICRLKSEKGQEKSWSLSANQALIVKMLDEARKTNKALFLKEIKEHTGSNATSLLNAFRYENKGFNYTLIDYSPSRKGHRYSLKKTFLYKPE